MAPPRLRSPLARAVVPVLGGLAFFAVLGVATWGIAMFISDDPARTADLYPVTQELGSVERRSENVEQDGPILLPGLDTDSGKKNLVVDHEGENPADGWRVYFAYPADRDASCVVNQQRGTSTYVDCDGREVDVSELAPAAGVFPVVTDRTTLSIDLRQANEEATAPTT